MENTPAERASKMAEQERTSREFGRGRDSAIKDLASDSELGRRPEWVAFPTTWERSSEDYRQGYARTYNRTAR